MEFPFAGSRMLQGLLVQEGFKVGRLHVATLMKGMGRAGKRHGFERTREGGALPQAEHLETGPGAQDIPLSGSRKLPIIRPNQVWAMDIPYIPMARGSSIWPPCRTGSPRPCPGMAGVDHARGRLLHRA